MNQPRADALLLFEAIKHGDAAHQEWLLSVLNDWFDAHTPAQPATDEPFSRPTDPGEEVWDQWVSRPATDG